VVLSWIAQQALYTSTVPVSWHACAFDLLTHYATVRLQTHFSDYTVFQELLMVPNTSHRYNISIVLIAVTACGMNMQSITLHMPSPSCKACLHGLCRVIFAYYILLINFFRPRCIQQLISPTFVLVCKPIFTFSSEPFMYIPLV